MRRSPSSAHSEWISLLDIAGPFLSRKTLERAFPLGLDTCPSEVMQDFRLTFAEWEESKDFKIHSIWIEWVVTHMLEYDDDVLKRGSDIPESCKHSEPEHREEVRPTFAVVSPENPEQIVFPVLVFPREQRLGSPIPEQRWAASPNQRMQCLIRSAQIPIGLVTNGAEWCVVHVKESETTGFVVFRSDILADEPLVLRAFYSLLGIRRVIGAADGDRLHELLLASREDEEELTTDLGRQVRAAVELLVREIDHLDLGSGRQALQAVADGDVYNATLTLMMRLMFLLCAEERKLLPVEESETYNQFYAASTLLSQLEDEAAKQGEEILERRYDAWMRLAATSRLIFMGSAIPELQMTSYGGSLFDPDKYPFMERLRVNNRVVLHVLEALQYIVTVGPTGKDRRRISFLALDVEQIGYVYESLLDHTARRADGCVLGLIGKTGNEPEIALSQLEAKRHEGDKALLKLLGEETERSEKALQKLLDTPPNLKRAQTLEVACGGDSPLRDRVLPFLGLMRSDPLGRLQVYPEGSLFVTVSDQRRGTGTHYTPRFLAEELVKYALEPLVYDGPSEGKPREEWRLRDARAIVNLRIADIAMGSGAFLVAVCRYLADRLTEAWGEAETQAKQRLVFNSEGNYGLGYDPKRPHNQPGTQLTTPFGKLAVAKPEEELLPLDLEERFAVARRIIADRCLYGVDINPMAAEMAKLSLWLITLRRDRPFTFLDHALKCGDSLVGVTLEELEAFSLKPNEDRGGLLLPWIQNAVNSVTNLRRLIRRTPSNTPLEVMLRAGWHKGAEEVEEALRAAANLLLTSAFSDVNKSAQEAMFNSLQRRPSAEDARELQRQLGRATFHFPLEFPDVFAEGGFHAIVGNPPFAGGHRITAVMGVPLREYLVHRLARAMRGRADLSAYFFLRAAGLLRENGSLGYLATNTISQGDTREVGLDQLLLPADSPERPNTIQPCAIFRAVKSIKWPSKSANLEVAKIWMRRGDWKGDCLLEGKPVPSITAFLDDGSASGRPYRLMANEGGSFKGSFVLGMGFVLEPEEAQALIARDSRNKEVLFPYLNGEDLNSRPDQSPSRWVINFFDWPLGRVGQNLPHCGESVLDCIRNADKRYSTDWLPHTGSKWTQAGEEHQKKWLQLGVVPSDYPGPVSADYPACLEIVERFVKPVRDQLGLKSDASAKGYARLWWQYGRKGIELYRTIGGLPRVLVIALTSRTVAFCFQPKGIIYSHATVVAAFSTGCHFAIVNSIFHTDWARVNGSQMKSDQRYTPTDCFETYPFPHLTKDPDRGLECIGEVYHKHRSDLTVRLSIGLTEAYNLFHRPKCQEADIAELRRLHVEMDNAVRDSYGWSDLDLKHDFYGEGKETRYTVAPAARQEVLRRLMTLNHARYADEAAAGLHDKGSKKSKAARRDAVTGVESLFGEGEIEEDDC